MTSNTINKLILNGFKKKSNEGGVWYEKTVKHCVFGKFQVSVGENYITVDLDRKTYPYLPSINQLKNTTTNINKVLIQLKGL